MSAYVEDYTFHKDSVLEPRVHDGRVVRCAHWTVTSEADVHEKNNHCETRE